MHPQNARAAALANGPAAAEFDAGIFIDNQNSFPQDELSKYSGQRVAWSLDGTRMLASGKDEADVLANLHLVGIDPSQVVEEYIPSASEHMLL